MYCKHCGKIIDSDSRFCNHCGKSQESSSKSIFKKPIWVIYLIWTIANLCLLIGDKEADASDYFFPFTANEHISIGGANIGNWFEGYYDFSEFIVYVFVIPLLIYFVYLRIDKQRNKHKNPI